LHWNASIGENQVAMRRNLASITNSGTERR
jgi:hypothetical protein